MRRRLTIFFGTISSAMAFFPFLLHMAVLIAEGGSKREGTGTLPGDPGPLAKYSDGPLHIFCDKIQWQKL